jgi:hypothetical protein
VIEAGENRKGAKDAEDAKGKEKKLKVQERMDGFLDSIRVSFIFSLRPLRHCGLFGFAP